MVGVTPNSNASIYMLTMNCAECLQGVCNMEKWVPSRNIDKYVKVHQFELVSFIEVFVDVVRGLIYMHSQVMVQSH